MSLIFSGKSLSSLFALLIKFYKFYLYKRILKIDVEVTLDIEYRGCKTNFTLVNYLDFSVLTEVFINEEYNYFISEELVSILDLGAHVGDSAIFYAGGCPNSTVYAVEPFPDSYARLVDNTKTIPNIKTFKCAIGATGGKTMLNLHNGGTLGNSTLDREGDTGHIEVKKMSIKELMNQEGIIKFSLIKFDIEGSEFELFEDPDFFNYADIYVGEVHTDLNPNFNFERFKSKLKNFNFEYVSMKRRGRFLLKAVRI